VAWDRGVAILVMPGVVQWRLGLYVVECVSVAWDRGVAILVMPGVGSASYGGGLVCMWWNVSVAALFVCGGVSVAACFVCGGVSVAAWLVCGEMSVVGFLYVVKCQWRLGLYVVECVSGCLVCMWLHGSVWRGIEVLLS
jgi:hypothetical protein